MLGFIDLQDYDLPMCDGDSCYNNQQVQEIRAKIEQAKGIILATPIYNFNAAASAKNLIELTGDAWDNKIVSFLCAAGGKSSYMSILPLANSLMLDFRCVILPNYVYEGLTGPGDRELGPTYVQGNLPTIERQLKKAGLRLGQLLNEVLDP